MLREWKHMQDQLTEISQKHRGIRLLAINHSVQVQGFFEPITCPHNCWCIYLEHHIGKELTGYYSLLLQPSLL